MENPNKNKKQPWKCILPIIKSRVHESIYCDCVLKDSILQSVFSRGVVDTISKGDIFMREIRLAILDWIEKLQMESFQTGKGSYRRLRGTGWHWDPLVYSLDNPQMRLLRKLRLGVSELAAHCFFLNKGDKKCRNCVSSEDEDLKHYFFDCLKYSKIRTDMHKELHNIWGVDIDLSLRLVLGFSNNKKNYGKSNREKQRKSYICVCNYIEKSSCFRFK